MDLVDRIDALIDERHLLGHSFYRQWVAGTLPPENLREYARQYAYERQVPAVAQAKIDGLRERYGVTGGRTLGFFETHALLDIEHSEAERRIVRESGSDDEEAALAAATSARDGWWDFLDGVLS